MRHRKGFNHLSRTSSHRRAMLANMASSLIIHKRITTTTAKAKALRTYVEPLITRSKEDTTHSRRVVFSYLQDKNAVTELFREVAAKVANRPGGYTRILKIGTRQGDNADMCVIELVDYNEAMLGTEEPKQKTARRRRGGKKKQESHTVPVGKKEEVKAPGEKGEKPAADLREEETSAGHTGQEPAAETETVTEEQKTEAKPVEEKGEEEEKKEKQTPETQAKETEKEDNTESSGDQKEDEEKEES